MRLILTRSDALDFVRQCVSLANWIFLNRMSVSVGALHRDVSDYLAECAAWSAKGEDMDAFLMPAEHDADFEEGVRRHVGLCRNRDARVSDAALGNADQTARE